MKPSITKADLVDRLAGRFPALTHGDAQAAADVILSAIRDSLARGDRVEIRGFGCFALNYRQPKTGRNPKTGEKVQVPAKEVPHFKPGKEMRERVDLAV